jgi:hypothetical protein
MGKKKHGNGYGKGTFIEAAMFLSPAFISLGQRGTAHTVSASSVLVLILFLGKREFRRMKHKGSYTWVRTDENRFTLTYKELQARGISQARATRSIDELLAKGFIEIIHPGGLCENDKAVYALREDFKNWRSGDRAIRTRQKDVHRGFQGQRIGATYEKQKTKPAHVTVGHPHARQRGTPFNNTRTSTWDTP